MSIFDRHKVLHGLPLVGQSVVYSRRTQSWFTNVEEAQDKLVLGQTYTVRKTELNSSSTYVWLQEFPNIFDDKDLEDGRDQPFFNMASFTWVPPAIDFANLIGLSAPSCLTLHRTYGVGILFNNTRVDGYEGDPEINFEYDINDPQYRVTKAEWYNPHNKSK